MRSASRTVKLPVPLIDAIEHMRQPGQPLADYPSINAAFVGLVRYSIAFPRPHHLTAGIADLPAADQDKIDDLLAEVARTGIDLRSLIPRPATAEALLELAQKMAGKPPR